MRMAPSISEDVRFASQTAGGHAPELTLGRVAALHGTFGIAWLGTGMSCILQNEDWTGLRPRARKRISRGTQFPRYPDAILLSCSRRRL